MSGKLPKPNNNIYPPPIKIPPPATAPANARYTKPHGNNPLKNPNVAIPFTPGCDNECPIFFFMKLLYFSFYLIPGLEDDYFLNKMMSKISIP